MRSHSPGCSQRRDASRSRRCLCAWSRTITNRVVNADALMGAGLPEWWAPGTPGACIAPPPAPSPRTLTLTLTGGFTVLDSQQRRLHDRARLRGYSDLHGYLLARAQQQASPAQLASELAPPPRWSATCWTPQA